MVLIVWSSEPESAEKKIRLEAMQLNISLSECDSNQDRDEIEAAKSLSSSLAKRREVSRCQPLQSFPRTAIYLS